ncbi:MAG: CGNR zinc finger domain-containing protein [Anaerolineae bacterium]|nr:CGNR zinc finger domain-containing protein [Anaerolineae bacterium]
MENLSIEFINSQWYGSHPPFKDGLGDTKWMQTWQNKWNIVLPDVISENETSRLYNLRNLLSRSMEFLSREEEIPEKLVIELNGFLEGFPLFYSINKGDGGYAKSIYTKGSLVDQVMINIFSSFLELVSTNDLDRIKRCQNPTCGWFFFDESKNNTRKWCGNTCSSLIKVRRFRERRKNRVDDNAQN